MSVEAWSELINWLIGDTFNLASLDEARWKGLPANFWKGLPANFWQPQVDYIQDCVPKDIDFSLAPEIPTMI